MSPSKYPEPFRLALYYRPSERVIEILHNKLLIRLLVLQVHSLANKIEYIIVIKCHYND
jgi:hypothetical protein